MQEVDAGKTAGRLDMVRERMGLLDEAIREHLELKRLRGADPGQVALEEREALGDLIEDEYRDHDHDRDRKHADMGVGEGEEPFATEFIVRKGRRPQTGIACAGPVQTAEDRDVVEGPLSSVSQETVELDMATVLYGDADVDAHRPEVPGG